MERPITALVIDGFHKGHVVRMEYAPVLKLLKPKIRRIDYCCGGDEIALELDEILEYKACFHGVDREVVLFSVKGKSMDFLDMLRGFGLEATTFPWTPDTILKMGYHNEPIIREDVPLTLKK